MDCRSVLWGFGVGLLGVAAGCSTVPTNPMQQIECAKQAAEAPPAKGKTLARRQPKAESCVAFGNFRLHESMIPGKAEGDQQQLRQQAREAFQQALKIDPKCLEAQVGLARLCTVEGRDDQAIGAFRTVIKAHPQEPSLWFELGMCHGRRKEWSPAVQALSRASELAPQNRHYANMLGNCLARAGAYQQAFECFRRIDGEARAHYNLARMLRHMKQDDLCWQQLQLAVQKDPKLQEARTLLAQMDADRASSVVRVRFEEQPQQQP